MGRPEPPQSSTSRRTFCSTLTNRMRCGDGSRHAAGACASIGNDAEANNRMSPIMRHNAKHFTAMARTQRRSLTAWRFLPRERRWQRWSRPGPSIYEADPRCSGEPPPTASALSPSANVHWECGPCRPWRSQLGAVIGQKLHTVIGALAGGGVQGRVQCFVGGGIFIASMGCSPRRMVFAWPIPGRHHQGSWRDRCGRRCSTYRGVRAVEMSRQSGPV